MCLGRRRCSRRLFPVGLPPCRLASDLAPVCSLGVRLASFRAWADVGLRASGVELGSLALDVFAHRGSAATKKQSGANRREDGAEGLVVE